MFKLLRHTSVWVLVLLASLFAMSAEALDIRVVTGDEFPPFADRQLENGGLATDIVLKIFKSVGYENVVIVWRSWLKGYEMTVDGEVDGTFPYAFTRTRGKDVLYSDPITSLKAYGWFLKSRSSFDTNLDLIGKNLCLPLGHAELGYTGKLFGNGQAKRVAPPDMKTCFKLLAAGRVDSVISPRSEAVNSIAAAGLSNAEFDHIPEALSDQPLHFIVGKKNPQAEHIIAQFNAGLKQLRESGQLSTMLDGSDY